MVTHTYPLRWLLIMFEEINKALAHEKSESHKGVSYEADPGKKDYEHDRYEADLLHQPCTCKSSKLSDLLIQDPDVQSRKMRTAVGVLFQNCVDAISSHEEIKNA